MVLFGLTVVRVWALWKSKYKFFSARGWSDIFNWVSVMSALGYLIAYYVCYGLDGQRIEHAQKLVDLRAEKASPSELRSVGGKLFSVYRRIGTVCSAFWVALVPRC